MRPPGFFVAVSASQRAIDSPRGQQPSLTEAVLPPVVIVSYGSASTPTAEHFHHGTYALAKPEAAGQTQGADSGLEVSPAIHKLRNSAAQSYVLSMATDLACTVASSQHLKQLCRYDCIVLALSHGMRTFAAVLSCTMPKVRSIVTVVCNKQMLDIVMHAGASTAGDMQSCANSGRGSSRGQHKQP